MQGDETGAARLRVSFAVDQAKTLAKQSQGTANPITDEQVQAYAKVITQQTQLNTTKSQTSFINQRLAIEEERIALAQRTGSISEIAALGKLGDARARAVSELEKQIAEMERIAKVRPLDIQLQIDTAQARLQLDSIKAELDPLKAKFDETFRSVGENFFSDLMNGKKPKDALTSFFGSIASEIKSVVSKQLSQQVFGKDGVFGGAGGMLSELFGGKKGDPAKPTIDTSSVLQSFSTLQTAGIDPTVSAFKVLAEAAQATAVTLSNIKGTDLPLLGGQAITPEETEDIGGFPMLSSAPRRDGATTGESAVTNLFRDASRSSGNLTDSNADATNSVLQLAKAAAKGSESLSGLPRIISAVQVLASAAGGSSGSNPGSLIGKVLGMAVSAYNGTHTEGFKYSGGVGYGWDQGFAKGGYTGDVAPDKKAGVVHGQEFVFSAPAVKAIGRSTLERAHREASAAPFFHSGGVVGRAGDVRPVPSGVFAHAGKYHTGGIVGQAPAAPRLAENEVPAFLMGGPKGVREEVLTANDPRHKDNLSPAVLAANERGVFALSVVAGVGGAGGQGGDARSAGGFASTSVTSDSRETDRSVLRESVARTNIASATNTSASDSVSVFTQAAGAPGSNGAPGAAGVAAIFQLGGIVGRIGVTRSAPVSIFQGAAKYHAGGSIGRSKQVVPGLEANEVPAILLKNEEVLTAKDPRHRNNLSPEMARVFNAAPRYHAGGVAGHTHDTALLAPAGSQYLNAGTAAASKSEPSMQGVINNYTVQVNATPGMTTQQAMNQGRDLQRGMQAQAGRRARNN